MKKIDVQPVDQILTDIKEHPVALKMKNFRQHGGVTTYDHCDHVAQLSYRLNQRLHMGANLRVLLVGAFLHDLCLYDWRDRAPDHRLHGYRHAEKARRNAEVYLHVGKREQDIIYSHMWPLNITHVPKSKEAWIVCLADKICAVQEFAYNAVH